MIFEADEDRVNDSNIIRGSMASLTHFDAQGQAHMVDVGGKPGSHRIAVACGRIDMEPGTLAPIQSGSSKKGDVIGIARIAGIQARSALAS